MVDQAADEDMAAMLEKAGQSHLLEGPDAEGRARLLAQARHLDRAYPGGLSQYVENARKLLRASALGENPFEGYTPSVPKGERVVYGDERFETLEGLGLAEARAAAFVLVAGGLGERLGFSGVKLALPCTVVAGWTYLEYYCRGIRSLQEPGAAAAAAIPLVIMTSDDTYQKTVELLEQGDYFGLARGQVHVLKQEKVACLTDSDAHLARDPKDPAQIETKPHGHGDVHGLLHSSGLARRFLQEGRKWCVFFQDTNGQFFRAVCATLGLSSEMGFDMNSVAVPRRPKDAMGGIARLTHTDGSSLTLNVEYNQLDPLLRSTVNPEGDVADETGYSPFPGNMNNLVIALGTYVATLDSTGGVIAEFVNPKYADATKTAFKSSTRLECMMQDFPKELPSEAKVGFTMFDTWCSYSPVKNDAKTARQKFESGNHPQSGTTGETDLFAANCKVLRMLGVEVAEAQKATFNGIDVDLEARVVWSPQWANSFGGVRARLSPGGRIRISQRSTLVLDGDITLENLELDGALVIKAPPGCRVRVVRLAVRNDGWQLVPVEPGDADEVAQIRGFRVDRLATRDMVFEGCGDHVVDEGASSI